MTKQQAAAIVKRIAMAHKKAIFGTPIIINGSVALCEVTANVLPNTISDWFIAAGVSVTRLETTGGRCVVQFQEMRRIERS